MAYLFSSESVSEGHPDKVADQISDALLDQFLAYDDHAHCAIESFCTTGQVVIMGEVRSNVYVDLQTIARKTIKKLSEGENQQVATWSPDSRHIAFVKDNNIFVTDGEKEVQVTKDGKFNEVINGIPDWVDEEEFAFNRAFAWNAD